MCKSHSTPTPIFPSAIYSLPADILAILRSLVPASSFQCSQVGSPIHKIHTEFASYTPDILHRIVRDVFSISPSEDITPTVFAKICAEAVPGFRDTKSAATHDFIRIVNWLRNHVRSLIGDPVEAVPIYENHGMQAWGTLGGSHILCEVMPRLTLPASWERDILAGYAMAAVAPPEITEIILVFPLQGFAHTLHVGSWKERGRFLEELARSFCTETLEATDMTAMNELVERMAELTTGSALMDHYGIGRHLSKEKTLAQSLQVIPDVSRAWQYFLSSPRMTRVSVSAEDVAASRAYITRTGARIFIHSPYIINLCQAPGPDNYGVACLRSTLTAAAAMGCRGVVVHVGKTVKMDAAEALANMRANVLACLHTATADCPLLLETPAGQGTETLLTYAEFFGFVAEIADPRLRVCVDTCHVFASGQCPLEYLQRAIREYPGWVRLIHFNDSLGVRGSCVDRHAPPGEGHIGLAQMTAIAEAGRAAGIGMVYE